MSEPACRRVAPYDPDATDATLPKQVWNETDQWVTLDGTFDRIDQVAVPWCVTHDACECTFGCMDEAEPHCSAAQYVRRPCGCDIRVDGSAGIWRDEPR